MKFGLKTAPAAIQSVLDIILSGVLWKIRLVYLDDVIMFSTSSAQHDNDVYEIPLPLKKASVTLELNKCASFNLKVDYFRHTNLHENLAAASAPTKAIMEAPFTTHKWRMGSFLGGCNV